MNIEDFSLADMVSVGAALRGLGEKADGLEGVAVSSTRYVYENLHGSDGDRACALVRFYTTRALGQLDETRRRFACELDGQDLEGDVTCLTLLGSAGDEEDWNDPFGSRGHLAIPLASTEVVARLPMIAQLIGQLGLDVKLIVDRQRELLVDLESRNFNVFFVENAVGSLDIPDQGFVERHRIRSVLGFGGLFPTGELFAMILFSRKRIVKTTAEQFRTIALSLKLACLPHLHGAVSGA